MTLALDGRRVAVTGGSGGIGLELCRQLRRQGAEVVSIDRAPSSLGDDEVTSVVCDLADPASIDDIATRLAEVGDLDGAVLGAGGAGGATRVDVHETSFERWQGLIDRNLTTTFVSVRALVPPMISAGGGSLVLVSSQAALVPARGLGPYAAAKAGMAQLAKVLMVELAEYDIRVNTVFPGYVRTPANRTVLDANPGLAATIPRGRVGEPIDIANTVVHLLSPASDFVNGAQITIDGGYCVQQGA